MKQKYPIVLASGSPRRRQLLKELGYSFHVQNYDFDENAPNDLAALEIAEFLAVSKMNQIPEKSDGVVYVTADTVVVKDNQVFGKPADLEDARKMLNLISGAKHKVVSAICIELNGVQTSIQDTCTVTFRSLDEEDISYYLDFFEPLDKAGAYGIQEWIGMIGIKHINGSYYTVMGLPTQELYQALKEL